VRGFQRPGDDNGRILGINCLPSVLDGQTVNRLAQFVGARLR